MVETILIAIGAFMIAATLLPLTDLDDWWVRVFDFPRLQITFLLAVALVAYTLVRDASTAWEYGFLAALGGCLAYQSYRMYPYTRLSRQQVQPSCRSDGNAIFSLLFANVLMTNRNAQALVQLVEQHDPDIFLAVECDSWWAERLSGLQESHPFTVLQPQENTYGMLLYSRLELRDASVRFLIQDDIPSIHACLRLKSGDEVELRCLHPRPPVPNENPRSTERDAELLMVGREMKQKHLPGVVLGDLNDVAWSRTNDLFRAISGMLDPRIGRGFYHTFNAKWPLIRFPLDHFFHTRHFRLVDFRRLSKFGSDHFPVYIKLSFEPDAETKQEHIHASPEDKQAAEEKIQEARH
ncbi:MAG: endonuclease/exonuclease/phosphatase family protein [Steroidobacteraceae bacterium]